MFSGNSITPLRPDERRKASAEAAPAPGSASAATTIDRMKRFTALLHV
jgi:hypothetical protein